MLRNQICIILIFLLVGCSLRPTSQPTSSSGRELTEKWNVGNGGERQ